MIPLAPDDGLLFARPCIGRQLDAGRAHADQRERGVIRRAEVEREIVVEAAPGLQLVDRVVDSIWATPVTRRCWKASSTS